IVLSAIGIYGSIAQQVAEQKKEIGIRMALGATRREVVAEVLGRAIRLTGIGIVLGTAAAAVLLRFIGQAFYGLENIGPVALAAASAILLVAAVIAAAWPAARAATIDPVITLRQ